MGGKLTCPLKHTTLYNIICIFLRQPHINPFFSYYFNLNDEVVIFIVG